MSERSNEEWLYDLSHEHGARYEESLEELRDYLLRAVLVYLRQHRGDLDDLALEEIRQLAEDLAQDALLAIQEKLTSFRGDARFTTWAYRFVINRAISYLRRRTALSYEALTEQKSAMLLELIDEGAVDPRVAALRRSVILQLRQIIDSELTERQRLALMAVYFDNRSITEVAEVMEMSPNALYKLLHDARKKIKQQLQRQRYSAGDILALFEEDW
jgi:RNA polymerase sigma-70 factor (ECF subfamily)